eukprot:403360737
MKAQQTNPMRISHESLDLDDIISDLNDGNIQVTSTDQRNQSQMSSQIADFDSNQNQTTIAQKQLVNNTKSVTKELKSNTLAKKEEVTSKIGINNSSSIAKTQSKSKIGLNKENTSKISNQARVEPSKQQHVQDSDRKSHANSSTTGQKDYLQSTTTETNTNAGINGVGMLIHDRYGNSDYKFDSISNVHTDDFESVKGMPQNQQQDLKNQNDVPFYMNRNQQSSMMGQQQISMSADEDVEGFQKKLDTLIINFRSETISEFMRTKKQVLTEQNATIDGERRRCNTLLGVKQNEIEQLKESLGQKTKMCDELGIRCEIMALWAGKGKTLARMKVLQFKCFNAFKQYREFRKHSQKVLAHKLAYYRKTMKQRVFSGWEKQYKEWKIVKNKDDFEKAVKLELQSICAQYSKEIESLRKKLDEANTVVEQENKNKAMMQENLKKAFMRGVCALNFEAMNILNPNDIGFQGQIEKEMEKQVQYAMNDIANQSSASISQRSNFDTNSSIHQRSPQKPIPQLSGILQQNPFDHNQSYTQQQHYTQNDQETYQAEKRFMQLQVDNNFGDVMDYKKVETKDSLWKPAPIMGREITQSTYNQQPTQITQLLKQTQPQQQQNYVLPSHFSRINQDQTLNTMQNQYQNQPSNFSSVQTFSNDKVLYNQQLNYQSSSLPDFASGLPQVNQSEAYGESPGKQIYAQSSNKSSGSSSLNQMTSVGQVSQTSNVGGKTINVNKTVSVNQTTKKGQVTSTVGKKTK